MSRVEFPATKSWISTPALFGFNRNYQKLRQRRDCPNSIRKTSPNFVSARRKRRVGEKRLRTHWGLFGDFCRAAISDVTPLKNLEVLEDKTIGPQQRGFFSNVVLFPLCETIGIDTSTSLAAGHLWSLPMGKVMGPAMGELQRTQFLWMEMVKQPFGIMDGKA